MKKQLLLVLWGVLSYPALFAANVSTNPKATATVSSSCSLSIANLNFGNVTAGQASSSATTTLNVVCSKGLSYQYYANFSQIGTDCIYMAGASKGDKLYYDIVSNSVWLRPPQYGGTVSSVGTGSQQSFTWTGYVNPSAAQGYPYANGCLSKNPNATSGKNPYVTPDTYSDTATAGVVF